MRKFFTPIATALTVALSVALIFALPSRAQLTMTGAGAGGYGAAAGGITQPSGLITYYTFDNASTTTTTATDTNPNSFGPFNLTLNDTPTSATGQISQGRLFASASTQWGTSSAFQAPQTALSTTFWINLTSNTFGQPVNQEDAGGAAWAVIISGGNVFASINTDISNYTGRNSSGAEVTIGSYHHVAVTWNGGLTPGSTKIYVDGVQVDNADHVGGSFTGINSGSIGLSVAGRYFGGNVIDGALDDVRLYNRELSSANVTAIYTAGLAGNP